MFKKASRKNVKLKLAFTGPSGSGKTYSALLLATGITTVDKIAVIDTENGSASLYSNRFLDANGEPFSTVNLSPPYTTARYIEAIDAAISAGFEVLILDSISHAWQGEGSILDRKTSHDARNPTANSYTSWAQFTKEQEAFVSKILNAPIHLFTTMRSKQDYVLSANEKGKMTPKKVGLAPIQRDGMEYEFTTVFDISMNHEATTSKDRTELFDGQYFKITQETGKKLIEWVGKDSSVTDEPEKDWSKYVFERGDYVNLRVNECSNADYLKRLSDHEKTPPGLKKVIGERLLELATKNESKTTV